MPRETAQQLRAHIATRLSIQAWLPALRWLTMAYNYRFKGSDASGFHRDLGSCKHVKTIMNNNIKLITIIIKTYLKGTFVIDFDPQQEIHQKGWHLP